MIVHVVDQGSPKWHALRRGIPTASEFDKILTPKTEKFSSSARPFALRLVAERLLQVSLVNLDNVEAVKRGKELEPEAVQMYEFEQGVETSPVGFITTDDGRVGASPDRLVDQHAAGVELKCPAPQTHLGYLIDGFGTDYKVQVQGQMMVGDLEWVDRYSYHPALPPHRERTHRDELFIAKLRSAVEQFLDLRDELMREALRLGAIPVEALAGDTLDELERIRTSFGNRNLVTIPSLESIDAHNPLMGG